LGAAVVAVSFGPWLRLGFVLSTGPAAGLSPVSTSFDAWQTSLLWQAAVLCGASAAAVLWRAGRTSPGRAVRVSLVLAGLAVALMAAQWLRTSYVHPANHGHLEAEFGDAVTIGHADGPGWGRATRLVIVNNGRNVQRLGWAPYAEAVLLTVLACTAVGASRRAPRTDGD
jgi:hypothetical protein